MSDTDWITDLARLAHAATPGPWRAALLDGVSHEDGSSSHRGGIYPGTAPGPPPLFVTNSIDKRDAKFIAAANPATILRLIEDSRESQMERTDLLIERDALAARLAAVEALLEWAETDPDRPYVITGEQVPHAIEARQLRAALAAPTDTTKEN